MVFTGCSILKIIQDLQIQKIKKLITMLQKFLAYIHDKKEQLQCDHLIVRTNNMMIVY